MKILQPTFFLFVFIPLVKLAPPIQQESFNFYDYDTDFIKGKMVQQDDEMKFKDVRKVFYLYYAFKLHLF